MDENLHNIEDLFRSNLEDYEDIPSQNVWEAVDKQLDKDDVYNIKRKYTNLKRVAVVLLLLLLSTMLYEIRFIYKNNSLAKNGLDSDSQLKTKAITDNFLDQEKKINPEIIIGTAGRDNAKKGETLLSNSDDKKPGNDQQLAHTNLQFQKQGNNKIKNSKEDINDDFIFQRVANSSKIQNGNLVQNEQALVEIDNKQINNPMLILNNSKNISPEEAKFQSVALVDGKKLFHPVSSLKTNHIDTNISRKTAGEKMAASSKFSLTPFFSPDIPWYRLEDDKIDNPQEDANEIEKGERYEFSFTIGMAVGYKINERWGLRSGVTFSNTNITVEPKTIYAQPDISGSIKYRINTSSGFGYILPSFSNNPVTGDSLFAFTSSHSLQYIGIPLAATYSIIKGKFTFNAIGGISANILTRAKLETTVEKGFHNSLERVNNLQGLKGAYFSGLIGVGVDYQLSQGTSLTFEPVTRFAINSINRDAPVKSYPMSIGFAAGVKIDL